VGHTHPANSSGTSLAIGFASIQPPGVRIIYDGLVTVSDNSALLAHAEVMKSCDASESNKMMIGCPNSKKAPASTSSPSGISSIAVWLTQPLTDIGALSCPLGSITVDVLSLGALPLLGL
jgi:hypothetical protein